MPIRAVRTTTKDGVAVLASRTVMELCMKAAATATKMLSCEW